MLELDILLERFLARYFERLDMDELRAFDAFLDLPDNEFWNILQMKNLHAKSTAQQSILDKLHALEGA
jgi:succinate dehydrogenase flavin-adding protein (antitoxin of CptAB toxin-antitoxin module)